MTFEVEIPSAVPESQLPKWLNKVFLSKFLRKHYGDENLKIHSFQVTPASAKGENYTSLLFRVVVQYTVYGNESEIQNLKMILKTTLPDGFAFDTLSSLDVYNKEIEFYEQIAPQINRLLEKLNEKHQLLPGIYGACQVNKVILFEDMALKGYGMASVHEGFDFDETKYILKKAAVFHAICAVLQEQQPDIFKNFQHGVLNRTTDKLNTFYLTQLDTIIEVLLSWPMYVQYAEKLKKLRSSLIEKGRSAYVADPNHFNSFTHGDLWTNNFLMKSRNGTSQIENMVFIDFQYSCWTSPAIDLHYFLNTSLKESLRPDKFGELIEHYHQYLTDSLEKLNYEKQIPTLQEFQKQFDEKVFYGFMVSCLVQPFMINDQIENADYEALTLGDERSMEFKRTIYSSPKTQMNLKKLIPFYDQLGIFD